MTAAPPPGSREAVAHALRNVTLAVIGALGHGATFDQIDEAMAQAERIVGLAPLTDRRTR